MYNISRWTELTHCCLLKVPLRIFATNTYLLFFFQLARKLSLAIDNLTYLTNTLLIKRDIEVTNWWHNAVVSQSMCLILKKEVTELNFDKNTQPRFFFQLARKLSLAIDNLTYLVKQLNFFRCPCLNLIHRLRATPEFNLSKKLLARDNSYSFL